MKKLLSTLVAALFVTVFPAQAAFAAPLTVKVGHVLNTDHNWHVCLEGWAKDVRDQTNGRVEIKIFPSSQLGSEKDMVEGLRMGTVDAGLIGGSSFQNLDAKFGIEELPYAFDTYEAAYKVFDGFVGDELFKILDAKGIKGLSWWENGFRHITNNKRPILTPEDLKGVKIRVTPNKIRLDTFNTIGASPMPIAFGELYSALQQGVVDAQENPLSIFYSNAFYEVQKYLSLTQHIWGSALLSVNQRVWKKISREDQEIMQKSAHVWRDRQRQMVQDADKQMIELIRAKGVNVNEVDKKPFREAVAPVWKEFEPVFGKDLMEQMR
jgi:tripartite ATP-independent transporter DctP family solute receptor